MYRNGPNIYPTCGMACASKLCPPKTNDPHTSHSRNMSSASVPTRTYADTPIGMCVVSGYPKIMSIFVTIRRSVKVHPCIGMVQISILLVELHVLPNCLRPIPMSLALQNLQIVLLCLQGSLGITPILLVLTLVLTK